MTMLGTLNNIVCLLFIFVFLAANVTALRGDFPTCRSRDTCIRMTLCAPYMNLIRNLKKPLSRASVVFLRRQECGFDGMYPMVCCFPSNVKRQQNSKHASLGVTDHFSKPSNDHSQNINIQFDESPRPASRPDFTLSDLSEYKSTENKHMPFSPPTTEQLSFVKDVTSTEASTTTTEKIRTTTNIFLKKLTTPPPNRHGQSEEAKQKRAEDLKNKMDAINKAFLFSSMDYFFARRMDDQRDKVH